MLKVTRRALGVNLRCNFAMQFSSSTSSASGEDSDEVDFSRDVTPNEAPREKRKSRKASTDAASSSETSALPDFSSYHPPELSLRAAQYVFNRAAQEVEREDDEIPQEGGYDTYGETDKWGTDEELIETIDPDRVNYKAADVRHYRPGGKSAMDAPFDFRKYAAFQGRLNNPYAQFDPKLRSHLFNWLGETHQPAEQKQQPEMKVSYCIFCHHGTDFLLPDNTTLLSQFISHKGLVLPKRLTHCCAKHQRKLARTIKLSRNLGFLPWQTRLHPKLRFSSLKPSPSEDPKNVLRAYGGARESKTSAGDSAAIDSALKELDEMSQSQR